MSEFRGDVRVGMSGGCTGGGGGRGAQLADAGQSLRSDREQKSELCAPREGRGNLRRHHSPSSQSRLKSSLNS